MVGPGRGNVSGSRQRRRAGRPPTYRPPAAARVTRGARELAETHVVSGRRRGAGSGAAQEHRPLKRSFGSLNGNISTSSTRFELLCVITHRIRGVVTHNNDRRLLSSNFRRRDAADKRSEGRMEVEAERCELVWTRSVCGARARPTGDTERDDVASAVREAQAAAGVRETTRAGGWLGAG